VKAQRITICVVVACLAGLFAWALLATSKAPPLSATFLGYTNSGPARLGLFAVSNSSARAYIVVGYFGTQVSAHEGRGAWTRGTNAAGAFLPAGDCKLVAVPAPVQPPWRASLTCRLDCSGDRSASTMFLAQAAEMGVPTRYRSFEVRSDWIAK
jgi:hypothetical protein